MPAAPRVWNHPRVAQDEGWGQGRGCEPWGLQTCAPQAVTGRDLCVLPTRSRSVLPRDAYPRHREREQQDQQCAGAGGLLRAPHGRSHPCASLSAGALPQCPRGWGQLSSSCMALRGGGTSGPQIPGKPSLNATSLLLAPSRTSSRSRTLTRTQALAVPPSLPGADGLRPCKTERDSSWMWQRGRLRPPVPSARRGLEAGAGLRTSRPGHRGQ